MDHETICPTFTAKTLKFCFLHIDFFLPSSSFRCEIGIVFFFSIWLTNFPSINYLVVLLHCSVMQSLSEIKFLYHVCHCWDSTPLHGFIPQPIPRDPIPKA